jgi:hypothetical protein
MSLYSGLSSPNQIQLSPNQIQELPDDKKASAWKKYYIEFYGVDPDHPEMKGYMEDIKIGDLNEFLAELHEEFMDGKHVPSQRLFFDKLQDFLATESLPSIETYETETLTDVFPPTFEPPTPKQKLSAQETMDYLEKHVRTPTKYLYPSGPVELKFNTSVFTHLSQMKELLDENVWKEYEDLYGAFTEGMESDASSEEEEDDEEGGEDDEDLSDLTPDDD